MAAKMSLCNISYTYEHYVGINIEEVSQNLYHYIEQAFADLHPLVTNPSSTMDSPDYVDVTLCKKDNSIFYELDIMRRAVNIPHECQADGLVLEIFIQNSDGTRYKKRHRFHPIGRNSNINGKSGMRQLKISKDIVRKVTTRKQMESSEEGCLPELRPQIDFHDFLK